MSNSTKSDPLEGKGEEMIPEKGLPFDDIDEMPLEEIPPEERIPNIPEGNPPIVELEAIPEDDPVIEAIADSDEPSFDFSDDGAEAFVDETTEAFAMEASPWSMGREEAEVFIGEASEAFTPTEEENSTFPAAPVDELPEDEFEAPPIGFRDEGMSTHREDSPEDILNQAAHVQPFPTEAAKLPVPDSLHSVHTHAEIHHAGEVASQPMIDLLVTDEAMEAMWRRADQAQKDIQRHIHTLNIARPMQDQVQAGRNELMAGKAYYEDAERHIVEAEYRVQLSIQLEKWSKTLIPRLFIYLAVWFVLLIVAIFVMGETLFSTDAPLLSILAGSMIFGGIGGIIGAVLPLIKHYSELQDFSKSYTTWYVYSPFIGVAMGSIIFVIISAGVFSISAGSTSITLPYLIYISAGLAGYQHNVFTSLVKRMVKVLELNNDDTADAPKTNEKITPPNNP